VLCTLGEHDLLTSKPMHLLELDEQGQFWFYCQAPVLAHEFSNQYERANLSFSDESSSRYVSVACSGELVRDRTRIHALWSSLAKPWFPEGPDAPDLACLKFAPLRAELWDGPGNRLTQALAFAASVLAGKPVAMGEHKVLDDLPRPLLPAAR